MMRETGEDGAREALDEVDRQRAALAGRIGLPLWYEVLYALAMLALLVVAGLSRRPGHELSYRAVVLVIVAAIVVITLVNTMLGRAAGARLRGDRARAYASTRRPILLTGTVILGGSALTWVAAESVSWVVSVVVGVGTALVAVIGQRATSDAIRADIRHGRVAGR